MIKFLYLLVCTIIVSNESISQDTVNISFNESLQLEIGDRICTMNFVENGTTVQLKNQEIDTYIFKYPGFYTLELKEEESKSEHHSECQHHTLPNQLILYVDSIKMEFEPSSFKLSNPIVVNKETTGDFILIEATIENYYKTFIVMRNKDIHSAGIGTNITAVLDDAQSILKSGKHTLKYHLKGTCNLNSYLQFDFRSHNNTTTSVSMKDPVMLR